MVSDAVKTRSAPSLDPLPSPRLNPALLLEKAPWDTVCEADSLGIPMDAPFRHADCLAKLVEEKGAQCWHLRSVSGERLGMVVTQIDEDKSRELVIVAVYAHNPKSEFPLTGAISGLCEDLARAEKCDSIRFHTCRHSVARVAADCYGYRVAEIVMRKALV